MKKISKNLGFLASGNIISQIIPIALMPVISRLYDPGTMGKVSSIFVISSILATISTLRLELAIVLTKSVTQSVDYCKYVLSIATIFLSILFVFIIFYFNYTSSLTTYLGDFILIIPLMAWIIALYSTLSMLASKFRNFKQLSIGSIYFQVILCICSIFFGLFKFGDSGLIFSRMSATIGASLYLLRNLSCKFHIYIYPTLHELRHFISTYKQFPLYNLPYSLSGQFLRDLPILFFSILGESFFSGQYLIARMSAMTLGSFLNNSFSNYFYREAFDLQGSLKFSEFVLSLMKYLLITCAPIYFMFGIVSKDIFIVIFGKNWSDAGNIYSYIVFPGLLSVLTGWPERIIEIKSQQKLIFYLQITADAITIVTVISAHIIFGNLFNDVLVYSICQTIYHLSYLNVIFKLLYLKISDYLILVISTFMLYLLMYTEGLILDEFPIVLKILILLLSILPLSIFGVRNLLLTVRNYE